MGVLFFICVCVFSSEERGLQPLNGGCTAFVMMVMMIVRYCFFFSPSSGFGFFILLFKFYFMIRKVVDFLIGYLGCFIIRFFCCLWSFPSHLHLVPSFVR